MKEFILPANAVTGVGIQERRQRTSEFARGAKARIGTGSANDNNY